MINPRSQKHEQGYVSPTEHSMMRWAILEVLRSRELVSGKANEIDDDTLLGGLTGMTGVAIELEPAEELSVEEAGKRLRDAAGFMLGLEQPVSITDVVHSVRGLNAAGLKV